ncbi:helix-turn-helix domain-containing protein [bacterium]|nr:helix-turn-helix domain-containing protein [bacterium]
MTPQGLDWIAAITLFGGLQGMILAVALIASPRGNQQANRFLALFLIAFSVQIFDYIYVYTQSYIAFPHALYLSDFFILAVPYLFYRYVKSLTHRKLRFSWKELFHFLPSIVYLINAIPFYLQSTEYKIQYKLHYPQQSFPVTVPIDNVTVGAASALGLVYLVLSLIKIQRFRAGLKKVFSSIEAIQLRWLINLISGLSIILVIAIYYFFINHPRETDIVIPFSMMMLMCVVGYMGFRQPEIFTSNQLEQVSREVPDQPANLDEPSSDTSDLHKTISEPSLQESGTKYQRSSLKDHQAKQHVEQLLELMEKERIYRESDLNLLILSNQMGISTHHLSQILNEYLKQNFFDFVNKYRIEEAKSLMLDDEYSGNLLDIVFQTGFNSKSSFYNAFKKYTDMTPTQFKRSSLSIVS